MGRGSAATDSSLSIRDDIRIFHVDDEPGFPEMVGEFIERERDGLSVRTASSAPDSPRTFSEGPSPTPPKSTV